MLGRTEGGECVSYLVFSNGTNGTLREYIVKQDGLSTYLPCLTCKLSSISLDKSA